MTLTYVSGVQKWVCRIDPLNVRSFQLDIQWDPTRAQLDASSGILYKVPFAQNSIPVLDQAGGRLSDVGGITNAPSSGDVDIFELVFNDLQPGLPISQVPFTVFASSNDSIVALDTSTAQLVTFNFTQIAPTTRSAMFGVSPHIWDPDGGYNNGHTGGPGTWNTVSIQWDDLPLPSASPTPTDTAWNNATHATDVAVFGGDPGTGIVAVQGPISVGGFQFDNSGYDIQGGTLTLSAVPGSSSPIDTGANSATISSILTGTGFAKSGAGTLALTGANTYTGTTTINGGTFLANNGSGSGTGSSAVTVANSGAVLGGSGAISGQVGVATGGTLLGGSGKVPGGNLSLANNLLLQSGALLSVVLGPSGTHSTLSRTGGSWTFSPHQAFTFRNIGAQPGVYDNIITGLASDPGDVDTWSMTNAGFSGSFSYDAAGNIDLVITAASQAMQVVSISRLQNNHIFLDCRGVPSQTNAVTTSPDLITAFSPSSNIVSNSAGAFQYEDRSSGLTKRFYKLVYPAP